MSYLIYEDCQRGDNLICLDAEVGRRKMIEDYLSSGFGNIEHSLYFTLNDNAGEAAAKRVQNALDQIKRDLYSWLNDDCIEDFAYLYAAEVIE